LELDPVQAEFGVFVGAAGDDTDVGSTGSAAFNAFSVSNAAKAIMVFIFMAVVRLKGC
jgi:hypothetical protein